MPRRKEYADHAARQRAYVERQKRRAAAAVPKKLKPILQHLAGLRADIVARRRAIGCPRHERLNLPGPSGLALSSMMVKILSLLNHIEIQLDLIAK